jgi:N-acetylglutamate synthase-like GNAT family acetyltransferase
MIVNAVLIDADILTEIALKSKGYWEYTDEQLESWREDLTVFPEMFQKYKICKYLIDDQIAGFYILEEIDQKTSNLKFLFISPDFIKRGVGYQLLQHAVASSKKQNHHVMQVLSDPNAESFYAKHGFKVYAQMESSVPGRFLPEMELQLK